MSVQDRDLGARTEVAVSLHGELDVARADDVIAVVTAAVSTAVTDGLERVVVDMSDVPFVDSTALGAFITVYTRARGAGVHLRLAHANRRVVRLLDMTRLRDTLT